MIWLLPAFVLVSETNAASRSSVQRYGYVMTVSLGIAENAITTAAMKSVLTSRKGLYACACKDGHMYAIAALVSLCANYQSSSIMPAKQIEITGIPSPSGR
jgi:hypothetical protein